MFSRSIVYTEIGSRSHDLSAEIWYTPQEGLRYLWTEGQEKTKTVVTKYEKKSFNLFGVDSDWLAKDARYVWRTTQYTDGAPLLESEVLVIDVDWDVALLDPGELVTLESGHIVRTLGGLIYCYEGDPAAGVDLTSANYGDPALWLLVDATPTPAGAVDMVYTIEYELRLDTDVEIVPGDIIKVVAGANRGGIVDHLYAYQGQTAELVLSDQDYSSSLWTDVTSSATTFKYKSDYKNSSVEVQSWTTGGGWLRKKTVHTKTTEITGQKDYYTHTLKADYPHCHRVRCGSGASLDPH